MSAYKFACPNCQRLLSVEDIEQGTMLDCPTCQHKVMVPYATTGQAEPRPYSSNPPLTPTGASRPADDPRSAPLCNYPVKGHDLARHFELMPGERIVASYYARKREPKFRVSIFILLLILYVIPGFLYVLWYFGAKREHGWVAVTNRRLLWMEYGKGWGERQQEQVSLNLHSIAAVELYTQHGVRKLFDLLLLSEKKAFLLKVLGRYPITLTIGGLAKVGVLTGGATSTYEPADNSLELVQNMGSLILELQRNTAEGLA